MSTQITHYGLGDTIALMPGAAVRWGWNVIGRRWLRMPWWSSSPAQGFTPGRSGPVMRFHAV